MALKNEQKRQIQQTIANSLRNKLQKYELKDEVMPFHFRLLGKDRLALYWFMQSLFKTFRTTIFEPVIKSLAQLNFASAEQQQTAGSQISSEAQKVIQNIMYNLAISKTEPNKLQEIKAIREVCQKGKMKIVKPAKVNLKLIGHDNTIYLLDIKTTEQNIVLFEEFKRTLLEWVATTLATNPTIKIQTLIAFPYNLYEPKPYPFWKVAGMLDLREELMVAETFWDFLGGKGAYNELLDCFERAGIELRPEIDEYFARFSK